MPRADILIQFQTAVGDAQFLVPDLRLLNSGMSTSPATQAFPEVPITRLFLIKLSLTHLSLYLLWG
jgi:hypothetical protein